MEEQHVASNKHDNVHHASHPKQKGGLSRNSYIALAAAIVIIAAVGLYILHSGHTASNALSANTLATKINITSAGNSTANPIGYTLYSNATYGVSMDYPTGWQIVHANQSGSVADFISPINGSTNFRPNINVVFQNLSSYPITLSGYANLTETEVHNVNGTLISVNNITMAGYPGKELTYTANVLPNYGYLEYTNAFTVAKGNLYIITYIAEKGQYQEFSSQSQNMISTFKITGQALSGNNAQSASSNYNVTAPTCGLGYICISKNQLSSLLGAGNYSSEYTKSNTLISQFSSPKDLESAMFINASAFWIITYYGSATNSSSQRKFATEVITQLPSNTSAKYAYANVLVSIAASNNALPQKYFTTINASSNGLTYSYLSNSTLTGIIGYYGSKAILFSSSGVINVTRIIGIITNDTK